MRFEFSGLVKRWLRLVTFIGLTLGMVTFGGQAVFAAVDPVPDHIANIDHLFALPSGSDSVLPDKGVTVVNNALPNQSGAIWSQEANKIDLTKDFTSTMLLNFGDSAALAADGMAFVMHNDSSKTGAIQPSNTPGNQLGVWAPQLSDSSSNTVEVNKAIQNSFAVEFDTYQNNNWDVSDFSQEQSWGRYSINETQISGQSHIAYGFPSQTSSYYVGQTSSGIFGLTTKYSSALKHQGLQTFSTTISNGRWHTFKVSWSAANKTLTYSFDNQAQPTVVNINPMQTFGSNSVYWGFTGKTGTYSERNAVAFQSISNIPTTKQDFKSYHKNADGSQGNEVTQTNPAKPNEDLLGVINGMNTSNTTDTSWKSVAIRGKKMGTDSNQGYIYNSGAGITINGKKLDGSSNFQTPAVDLNGNAQTVRNAKDTDLFSTKLGDYGTGINLGDIAMGSTITTKVNFKAGSPTPTDGKSNLGSEMDIRLDGTTASEETMMNAYVTSVPTMNLNNQATANNPTIITDSTLTLSGKWQQPSNDSKAVGTLNYSIDDGPNKTVALNSIGGDFTQKIDLSGLSMSQVHKVSAYISNAGYNEKSNVATTYVTGGSLSFSQINSNIGFSAGITGQNQLLGRNSENWAPTVRDTRGKGSSWTLMAQASPLVRTSDNKQLDGNLVYVANKQTTNITNTATVVANKVTTTDFDETAVTWSKDAGIMLQYGGGAYSGEYTGTIKWTLASVPSP